MTANHLDLIIDAFFVGLNLGMLATLAMVALHIQRH